jgi:serine/threonine-protein kinase
MTGPGTTILDRYRIERELGAGGMATVYLAHDIRHDRRVALKVLRPELAAVIGGARFLAEIRTTANLQHPHILPLYDSGDSDGSVFYVMPFVSGESLRDRLNREKQLPVDDALRIAGEVADALDYAHRQGIVHRDIKPENILLHDGRALVADFGIALAVSRSDSSTRMTETGMSLGTPHYMSPEQAMGERELTARSDVYALGCVVYEMLTGEPPFTGPTAQAIVARVMTDAPRSITAQRHTVPAPVEAAVRRALEKLPADRFGTAGQFAEALRHPALSAGTFRLGPATGRRSLRPLTVALGAATLLASGLALWGWLRPPPPAAVSRYALSFPGGSAPAGMMHLSRTGSHIIYGGGVNGAAPLVEGVTPARMAGQVTQLWVKARNQVEPRVIPGTIGVGVFAVAPDTRSIAFIESTGPGTPGTLKRIPLEGGPAVTLADSAVPYGIAWLEDGTIVYPRYAGGAFDLWRVSEDGGGATLLWRADSTGALALPSPLPGGRGVVVTRFVGSGLPSLWAVDIRSGDARHLLTGALSAQYLPSGHLIYARADGALLALPFDAKSLEVRGTPIPIMDGVEISFGLLPQFAVAMDGTLLVRTGAAGSLLQFEAVWVDRAGRQTAVDSSWSVNPFTLANNVGWSLSPDERQLAIAISVNGNDDIWVKQLPRGPPTRLTFDTTSDVRPRWTPDGKSITYLSATLGGHFKLRQINADGSGRDTTLFDPDPPVLEGLWSPDKQWLLARLGDETTTTRDIVGLRPGQRTDPVPLIAEPRFSESAIALSPDGKWIAYESTEAGGSEVFIRPFPSTTASKQQVSTNGGFAPLWSKDGRELFFATPRREMMAVAVRSDSMLRLGERTVLFDIPNDMYGGVQEYYTAYDVARDGRFLMLRRARPDSGAISVVVIENFADELKQRARRQ